MKADGCRNCTVQPVQNRRGTLTYPGASAKVKNGAVEFRVPTARTKSMALLVYAPFDTYAQSGIPMVVVTRFKAKRPGAAVTAKFAGADRMASGCWARTTKPTVTNTLVVRKRRQGGKLLAADWLERTWQSQPYWLRLRQGTYHAYDPSICR